MCKLGHFFVFVADELAYKSSEFGTTLISSGVIHIG